MQSAQRKCPICATLSPEGWHLFAHCGVGIHDDRERDFSHARGAAQSESVGASQQMTDIGQS
jgi:hypothetical protein